MPIQGKIDIFVTQKKGIPEGKKTRYLNRTARFFAGHRVATVARRTPDQKVPCSNPVEVNIQKH